MVNNFLDEQEEKDTKKRILLEAAMLFAKRGYVAVSVRDIAKSANIKPASIYNHFKNKEELFNVIIDTIEEIYQNFYIRLDKEMEKTTSFKEVLDCLFAELKEIYDIFIFYGVSLIVAEQYRNKRARRAFNDVYMKLGIDYSKNKFDECIEKKWVRKFDTEASAIFFMNSVLVGSLIRTHEDMSREMIYDTKEMFTALEHHILNSVEIIKD